MGKGCKVLLIVGIILLAIIVVGGIIGYTQCDKIKSVSANGVVETIEKDLLANLPEGFDADEVKSTLKELKDKVQNLIAEKKVDLSKMAPMITELGEAMKDKKITTEEATKLIETIKTYIAKS
jgi:hypothetical protein